MSRVRWAALVIAASTCFFLDWRTMVGLTLWTTALYLWELQTPVRRREVVLDPEAEHDAAVLRMLRRGNAQR